MLLEVPCLLILLISFTYSVFIRTDFNDPLLCLTASITLRDKPLTSTPPRRDLFELIEAAGTLPPLLTPDAPEEGASKGTSEDVGDEYIGRVYLEEVNLLEGLPFGMCLYPT